MKKLLVIILGCVICICNLNTSVTAMENEQDVIFSQNWMIEDGYIEEIVEEILPFSTIEVECGYIKYSGVKYLYKEGLKKTKVATTAISLMISAVPGCGWGLSAVSLASSYGGYSALEKAVHKAYYKKKGIKVYYKIHKSVMSMNKVRYVVG